MKIVTDSGADLSFEECQALGVTLLPLKVDIGGRSYQSGVDIDPVEFYRLMDESEVLPITSTPSIGEFEEVYTRLAREDSEILSIHISSGLSGTFSAAKTAAESIKGATIKLIDTLTLSPAMSWQVKAAAQMAAAGKSLDEVVAKLKQIQDASITYFTLPELKYLIAGGRISHLKGILASILGIKPVIEISKEDGKYYDKIKKRSVQKAIENIPTLLLKLHPAGTELQTQICTAGNPKGGQMLMDAMDSIFRCTWLPTMTLGTALGAHTGRGLVGVASARLSALPALP